MLVTDVSGQSVGSISMDQAVQEGPFKIGATVCPETSLTTKLRCVTSQKSLRSHLHPRRKPEVTHRIKDVSQQPLSSKEDEVLPPPHALKACGGVEI
jgi:hypothetical protein